ncbi:MAG: DUF167 domain-containing protein [Verrucomicrobia bacterium]|nr:DUF167 domain-containing protein [Verrucomicrobiota bacterium]
MTLLTVKVIPNAPKNQIDGWQEGVLRVRIASVPEKGKANEELREFLADTLKISKSRVKLVFGQTSRIKRFEIEGLSEEEVILAFSALKRK